MIVAPVGHTRGDGHGDDGSDEERGCRTSRSTGSASSTTRSSRARGCRNQDRLGPYASEAEASHALDKVQERNEDWDHDPKWTGDNAPE